MRLRTESEMKAYIDGYNDSFKQFCEYLTGKHTVRGAIDHMKLIVAIVNGTVTTKESEEERGQ